ncbi:hypothetical protein JW899_04985 [Candidatus Uhrbacteria bacterium]|nr:hypothetical protein [Candidatus Uhrbacteria bacterium]
MGEYADVKRKRIMSLLAWLNRQEDFSVDNGGSHQWVVRHETWNRPFPIPFRNNTVSGQIVRALMGKVVGTGFCTKEEFDNHL